MNEKNQFPPNLTEDLLESQLKEKLSLTVEQRISAHENARNTVRRFLGRDPYTSIKQ